MLILTRNKNNLQIYNPTSLNNYFLESTLEIKENFDDYFLDKDNNVYIFVKNSLFRYKDELVKIDTNLIHKVIEINTNNYISFYYKSNHTLFSKIIYEEKEKEKEIIKLEENFDFFVNEREEIIIWYKKHLITIFQSEIQSANLNFTIKDVKPSYSDKLILIDNVYNFYLFDTLNLKVIGGIKSFTEEIICYDSSIESNLLAISTRDKLFILDLLSKQKVKEINFFGIQSLKFKSENILLIKSDILYEFDLFTNTTNKVIENNFESFKIYYENCEYIFNKPIKENLPVQPVDSINQSEKNNSNIHLEILNELEIKNSNLKSELFKIIFKLKDELESLKERVSKLEEENKKKLS